MTLLEMDGVPAVVRSVHLRRADYAGRAQENAAGVLAALDAARRRKATTPRKAARLNICAVPGSGTERA